MPVQSQQHYLKEELDELIRTDGSIVEFIEQATLDGIWFWNVEQPEDEWLSPRFKEVFGYDDDEIENTSAWWQQNIHPDDLPLALENAQKHLADPDHRYDQTVRYRHKDGSTIWVRCRGLAIRRDGVPVRMLGAHTDVTREVRVQERMQTIYGQTPALLFAVDRAGRVEYVTDTWLEFFGLARKDALGRNPYELMAPSSREYMTTVGERTLREDGRISDVPCEFLRGDGQPVAVRLTMLVLRDANDAFDGWLCAVHDVSREQQALHSLQTAESRAATLEQFAHLVSHDLRSPLRGIHSLTQFLEQDLPPEVWDHVRTSIKQIRERIVRMDSILQSVLKYARAGGDEYSPGVRLDDLLAAILSDFGPQVKQAEVKLDIDEDCMKDGQLPPVTLHHTLQNLIGNALEHHDGKQPHLLITARRDHGMLRMSVEDDGPGIQPNCHERVFQLFQSGTCTPTNSPKGVGLPMIRQMLVRARGSIELTSPIRDGRGCRFDVTVPMRS